MNAEQAVILIAQPLVSALSKPKGGILTCELRKGVFVPVLGKQTFEGAIWIETPVGWIPAVDSEKNRNFEWNLDHSLAIQSWDEEDQKRKRMASAIAAELVKSHPLPKVKRFVGSLSKHADKYYPSKPMVKIHKIGMEDIMISLGGKLGLTKQQLFEYIKVTASQQSNPPQAVLDIMAEINHLITFRPTQWVVNDLNVLETDEVRRKNDRFVMHAASGKLAEFQEMVEKGQELTCLHSELRYTALHAAADFGQTAIVDYIITTGVSLDMKDPRKQQTALHIAAYNNRIGVIKSLLAANADRTLGDMHGTKPYMYADMQGLTDAREMLKYLPPTIIDLMMVEATISTITVTWRCPTINPAIHAEITDFFVDCLPEDITRDEESRLTPVPATPALPKPVFAPGSVNTAVRVDYIYQKYCGVDVTQALFSNLTPCMPYRIRGKCYSVSGWSHFCAPIIASTVPYVPSTPDPVDICKISTNGLLLSWRKPERDNGSPIDFYQIELIFAKMAMPVPDAADGEDGTEETGNAQMTTPSPGVSFALPASSDGGGAVLVSQQSTNLLTKKLPAVTPKVSVASRFHRLIKHKNLAYLHKYLTGLEPLRPYQCRVRAHNALGFSPWSGWTGPIAPQIGVTVISFNPERLSATLSWFAPLLSIPSRQVEAYEVQMCCLRGPLTKSIDLLTSEFASHLRTNGNDSTAGSENNSTSKHAGKGGNKGTRKRSDSTSSTESEDSLAWVSLNPDGDVDEPNYSKTDNLVTTKSAKEDESNEFVTLRSDITENQYEVTGLRAGSRYKCRVRCKINDYPTWNPWDFSIISEVFSMPSTIPDPPFLVRASVGRSYSNAATTAAVVAQESNAAALTGTVEFLPRDSAPFPTSLSSLPPIAEMGGSIFDYDLADLLAIGHEEDAALRAAEEAEALRHQERVEQALLFGETPPPSAPARSKQQEDTLLPILMDSVKINERLSRKAPPPGANNKKQSIAQVEFETFSVADSDNESEFEDGFSGNSLSLGVLVESVQSSVLAKETDVDIKSGKFTPGAFPAGELEGPSMSSIASFTPVEVEEQLEIMHDSITISWQNGQANGLPIEGFIVEMARVRTYRLVDVVRAREAYQNVTDIDEMINDSDTVTETSSLTERKRGMFKPNFQETTDLADAIGELKGPLGEGEQDCWEWQDITETGGTFIGFQKFRAENLIPGCTYIFRVKQRNAIGWSPFSGASRMIATFPSVPPGRPTIFAVRSTYAAVRWAESDHPGKGLTNLEYEVQIGVIPHTLHSAKKSTTTANAKRGQELDTVWRAIEVRYFPTSDALLNAMLQENFDDRAATSSASVVHFGSKSAETSSVHVMLQKLISQITYVLRVRVRTIVGWSPWSAISAPFRTQA